MRALTAVASLRGYRQFYYGGPPKIADKVEENLFKCSPWAEGVGHTLRHFPGADARGDQTIVDTINATRPDIAWVGLCLARSAYSQSDYKGLSPHRLLISPQLSRHLLRITS